MVRANPAGTVMAVEAGRRDSRTSEKQDAVTGSGVHGVAYLALLGGFGIVPVRSLALPVLGAAYAVGGVALVAGKWTIIGGIGERKRRHEQRSYERAREDTRGDTAA